MKINIFKQLLTPSLSLFTSMSTLICCGLPTLLVTIGMGASLASFISVFPWITIIPKFKIQVFGTAGTLLILSFFLYLKERKEACPADSKQAKLCRRLKSFYLIILIVSFLTYLTGFFFAFIADKILY
tara:strand:+ start:442 stop:825 length:384 start_codon:yes stop_codon:yes gene_type:complete